MGLNEELESLDRPAIENNHTLCMPAVAIPTRRAFPSVVGTGSPHRSCGRKTGNEMPVDVQETATPSADQRFRQLYIRSPKWSLRPCQQLLLLP